MAFGEESHALQSLRFGCVDLLAVDQLGLRPWGMARRTSGCKRHAPAALAAGSAGAIAAKSKGSGPARWADTFQVLCHCPARALCRDRGQWTATISERSRAPNSSLDSRYWMNSSRCERAGPSASVRWAGTRPSTRSDPSFFTNRANSIGCFSGSYWARTELTRVTPIAAPLGDSAAARLQSSHVLHQGPAFVGRSGAAGSGAWPPVPRRSRGDVFDLAVVAPLTVPSGGRRRARTSHRCRRSAAPRREATAS
jgi:hypothetical protein